MHFHVVQSQSQHYALVDQEKNITCAWNKSTTGEYKSVCNFEDKGSMSAQDYVKKTAFSYRHTKSAKGQAALLIEKRMIWALDVIAWEDDCLATLKKGRKDITPEVERGMDPALVAARRELSGDDRQKCKPFMAVAKQFPFILRLNDDRGITKPVRKLAAIRLSAVYMKRVSIVIDAFIEGMC